MPTYRLSDAPLPYPPSPHIRQALAHIDALRPTGVVDPEWRLAAGERDLPNRHPDAAGAVEVDLGRVGENAAIR
jgi:hypothetical protein